MASSSLSLSFPLSPLSRNWKHHVFPSFHGEDVRKAFLSHILKEFRSKGIDPFIDNDIERSKSIGPELIEAIRGSRIAIVLLSKNYASSTWCMNELVEIMKCREELGQLVMTIFYEVDPTHVKKQTGDFGKVFRKTCKGKTKKEIKEWRKALEGVATIAGEHSHKWDNEAAMIEKIANDVSNMLNNSTPSKDFDGLVGMAAHMKNIGSLLCLGLDEVRMIGIWGPSGIGKTTIARFLFNQVSSSFQLKAIMVNIKGCYPRPCLDEYSAQLQLQNQMLSQIINHKDTVIPHLGVAQERLKDKKVFLVLDDVDRLGQLVALAKETWWFGFGSRIIITTEDLRVLKAHGINHIYKVDFPSTNEAFQIFCMYAFGQKYPYNGFYELAQEVTFLAGKLPLGLKVMGSYFRGMSKMEWKNALPRLWSRLDGEIESILKFSYDALCTEDKDLFIHIACCFNNQEIEKVEEHLAKSFLDVAQGIHVLTEKSLISINEGYIEMHNLLEQLGREIVRKQYVRQPWKRQFLVHPRDICEVFNDETTGSSSVIGITLKLSEMNADWNISDRAFEGMSNLQYLRFDYGHIHPNNRGLNYQFRKLRLLDWRYFPMTCLPSIFNTKFLIELNMRGSKLEKLWEGIQPLSNLKWMDLSYSKKLKELPNISTATNLKELNLKGCSSLVEIPSSIENATKLEIFDLSDCSSLVEIPLSIGNVINLKKLNLRGCSSLVQLPSSIGNITNFKIFDCDCSSLVRLPFSTGTITNLERLVLVGCSNLVELPSCIGNAIRLTEINLSYCSGLVELPSSIGNAFCLTKLTLRKCSRLVKIPSSIGNVTTLAELNLSGCSSLKTLPSSIGNSINLKEFNLSECSTLVELPSIGNSINLEILDLSYCPSLVKLPSCIENAINLCILDLRDCSSLVELPSSIENATNVTKLNFSGCSSLVEILFSIGNATHLTELNFSGCSSLLKLPYFVGNANNLKELNLSGCSSLVEFLSIGNCTHLTILNLSGCSSLVKLPSSIGNFNNLWIFDLRNCSSLVELPSSIGNATHLTKLNLSGCSSLVELPSFIGNAINLKELNLSGCSSLVEFPSIGNGSHLTILNLNGCSNLVKLPSSIGNAKNLRIFDLKNCSSLVEIPSSIGNATNLTKLTLSGCLSLVELPFSIGNATNLTELDLSECLSLVELPFSIGNATNLTSLQLNGCSSLVKLPSSIGNATKLNELIVNNCLNLEELPFSIGNLHKLLKLSMEGCSKLKVLSININMESLEEIDLKNCSLLKTFPKISTNIKLLKLNGTAIEEVPLAIRSWPRLQELHMSYCENLKYLPQALDSITELHLKNTEIQELGPWVKGFSSLRRLVLNGMHKLVSLPQLPDSLLFLEAENCDSLERLGCSFGNQHICLNFVKCFKLNQESRDLIIQTSNRNVAVLPGGNVPGYFSDRATGGTLTVKLNERPPHKSLRFRACVVLVDTVGDRAGVVQGLYVSNKIMDRQNGLIVPCRRAYHFLPHALTGHLYTFNVTCKKRKKELEAHVASNEVCFEFQVSGNKWAIKECGVLQLS